MTYYNAITRVAHELVAKGLFVEWVEDEQCYISKDKTIQILPRQRFISTPSGAIQIPPMTPAAEIRRIVKNAMRKSEERAQAEKQKALL